MLALGGTQVGDGNEVGGSSEGACGALARLACGEFLQSVGSRLDPPGRANGGAQLCRGRSMGAVCKHPLYRRSNLTC